VLQAPTIDLVSLIEQRSGIRLVRRATTGGGEYWGACPFCGTGDNRFHVWPHAGRPHYWCRVCDAKGDGVDFLRQYCHLSFVDACQELGLDPGDLSGATVTPPDIAELTAKDAPPCKKWQDFGKLIVERAERYLWHSKSSEGQRWLAYLRGRGLSDETIKYAHLGCIPRQKDGSWWAFSFADWGLDLDQLTEEQRRKGGVRIPDGIVIPWFEGDRLWKIAIKRPHDPDFSYGQVPGSGKGLYNVDAIRPDHPAMLVEGEFDCLSVMQEAGDLIACVATGGAGGARVARWLGDLSLASFVLQSFDDDAAGDAGSEYWMGVWYAEPDTGPVLYRPGALSNCVTRWSPALWKDPNELLQSQPNGVCTLREWVQYGIEAAQYTAHDARTIEDDPFFVQPVAAAQTEKRIEIIDGVRVFSGYSDQEYKELLWQEALQAQECEKEFEKLKNYWR